MSKLIPNTFQYPNLYIDKLSFFLSPEEEKVLNHAIRAILGWEDSVDSRSAYIALSIFIEGKFKRDKPKTEENRLSFGCGLSLNAVRKALASLDKYNILIKAGTPTQDGQLYTLQINDLAIDWAGLEARRAEQEAANQKRTRLAIDKATAKREKKNKGVMSDIRGGVMSDITPNVAHYPLMSDIRGGVMSDIRKGVMSDDNNETQFKPIMIDDDGGVNSVKAKSGSKELAAKVETPIGQAPEATTPLSSKQIKLALRGLGINSGTNRSSKLAKEPHMAQPGYLDAWLIWHTNQNAGHAQLEPGGILLDLEAGLWPPGWSATGEPPAPPPVWEPPLPRVEQELPPENDKWQNIILGQLQMQMTQATFDTWIKNTRVVRREDGHLVIGTKSEFAKDWLENRLYTTIRRTVRNAFESQELDVKFIVELDGADNGRPVN